MFGFLGARPVDLGVRNGALRPCPAIPNCVGSEAGTPSGQQVSPFTAPGGAADLRRFTALLAGWPRTTVVTQNAEYVHAECASRVFGFIDDLEVRLDAARKVIHVRSQARLGRQDFGVNRKRVEALREAWQRR